MPRRTCGRNYYEVLGVTPEADAQRLKQAYRRRVLETHPDLQGPNSDRQLFQQVREAYEVLSDPQARDHYDMATGLGRWARRAGPNTTGFGALFANLFAGLRSVLDANPEPPEAGQRQRRKAG
ncbi:MAG: J domain-containing protein [Candidatus Brocadiia bacterium]